mmetsp:Transcript_11559/g.32457  ORF Transcript_11559/g.32457 Transcript_11559/m.32457 type:complete len:87 (-) Transcript_11559:216-476(-)
MFGIQLMSSLAQYDITSVSNDTTMKTLAYIIFASCPGSMHFPHASPAAEQQQHAPHAAVDAIHPIFPLLFYFATSQEILFEIPLCQ